MPTANITKQWLDADQPSGGKWQTDYWDTARGTPRGFGVRVAPTGRKTFVVRYRLNGKHRCYKLGVYNGHDRDSLKAARKQARAALAKVDRGEDPAAEKAEKRKRSMTVGEFLDLYLEDYAKPNRKSWREDARRVRRIKAKLGKLPLADLKSANVQRLHTAIGKSAPVEANRTVELLRAALTWACDHGHLPENAPNVASRVKRVPEKPRERFVTPDEMPRVLEAIRAEKHVGVRSALMLDLMAGFRKSELLSLRWEHVDLDNRQIRVPETKTGKGRAVPLTDAAVRLLESIPRDEDSPSPWVFPGRYEGTHLSRSKLDRSWRRIREAAGIEDVTLHDLRRSCGSWLAMQGVGLPIIGKVLGHDSVRATALYARLQPDAGREALNRYGDTLAKLAEPGDEKATQTRSGGS